MERARQSFSALLLVLTIGALTSSVATAQSGSAFGYKVTAQVVYGQGVITQDGAQAVRDLWMDIY